MRRVVPPGESFWRQDCRGPGLGHTHSQHVGNDLSVHAECPCRDCGVTPLVWARLMDLSMREAGVPASGEDMPLERRMATGVLAGPPSGPGRGELSDAWKAWASKAPFK